MTKIIFSRKGFNSIAGGIPSTKIGQRLQSFPIPYINNSLTTYKHLGLGNDVNQLLKNKIKPTDTCHNDPYLITGQFGQIVAAQSHLENNDIEEGDVFFFWGWFRETIRIGNKVYFAKKDLSHYRLFGWLQIGEIIKLGGNPSWYLREKPNSSSLTHTIGKWKKIIHFILQNLQWRFFV